MTELPASGTVLVIDDQEENIKIVGSVLSLMGYEIMPALSGEQAFKRLAVRQPDLILLDVMMPGTDGLAVCRELKGDARWANIPVIFLSAADDKNLVVQALESGGVDYVTKPFNKAELVSRVRTHLALKQARDAMQQLAEDRNELLGILTHDLKNHLTGIHLSAGLLKDRAGSIPDRERQLAENIHHSADRSLGFLKTFLENHSAGHLEVRREVLDLGIFVRAAVERHRGAAQAKHIAVDLTLPPGPVQVLGDGEALARVLDNLVTNAVKFTPEGGKVAVVASIELLGTAAIVVEDSGPGFSPEDRDRMFRRYGRLSARPTAGESSTGLGLFIVKQLVTSMKGDVQVDNSTLGGARVKVLLETAPAE